MTPTLPLNMHVTAARREDCRALAEIHVGSWQAAYASLFPAEYLASLSVPEREKSWLAILEAAASRTLVAKHDGETHGFVSFGRCRDEDALPSCGEVWALYVAPRFWSLGAGWALWEAARVQMLHAGYAQISLWVLSGNVRGLRFYESVGFRQELDSEQSFERGGATLKEMRCVFERMSANPSIERPSSGKLRLPPAAAQAGVGIPYTRGSVGECSAAESASATAAPGIRSARCQLRSPKAAARAKRQATPGDA